MQLKIALAAEEAAGARALQMLVHRRHRVVAVFTGSRSQSPEAASVASLARSLELAVRPAAEVRSAATAAWLRQRHTQVLLSVHCRHLIHAELLAVPPLGAYNLHPGPLPERAGLHPPSWALYEGDSSHGVTLHHMTPVYDDGPVVFAERFDVAATDTGLSVLTQCVRRGLPLVGALLDLLESGQPVPAHAQDLSRRRWFDAGPPEEGRLDWSRSARQVVDFVRACDYSPFPSPWGFPRCVAGNGLEIEIATAVLHEGGAGAARAPRPDGGTVAFDRGGSPVAPAPPGTVAHAGAGAVLVAAADAWVRVEQVEVEGRRAAAADVLADGERLARSHGELRIPVAS